MEPISAGLAIAGLGLQLFGGFSASNDSKHLAEVQKGIASDEQRINDIKRQQNIFESNRMQLQQYRNIQRLRAQGTAAAVNQGASTGSGLQGGLAATQSSGLDNIQGILGGLSFSNTIFGVNNDISNKKMQIADIQSDLAEDQSWASLGGALVKNSGTIGGLGQDAFAGAKRAASLWSPGSLSGGLGTT